MSNRNQSRNSRWLVVLSGFLVTVVFVCVYIAQPMFFSLLGLKTYDVMLRSMPSEKRGSEPLIVDLDESSLAAFGQWPWPRYRVAKLLDKLNKAGAAAIALDTLLVEPDRTSILRIQREMKRDLGIDFSIKGLPSPFEDNDMVLADSLAQGPFVLGYSFNYGESQNSDISLLHALDVAFIGKQASPTPQTYFIEPQGVITSLVEFAQATPASGFLNALSDNDGVLRRLPLVMRFKGKYYPSLALATLMKARSEEQIVLNTYHGKLESLSLSKSRIPLDEKGNLLLYYYGKRGSYEYISAADVLLDRIDSRKFKDKIVIVGATAAGLHDFHVTPLDSFYPGVEVHATMIDNLLHGKFLWRPLWARGAEFAALLFAGILATFFLAWARPWMSVLFFFGAGSGLWYSSFLLFKGQGVFFNPLYAIAAMVVNFILLSLFKYWREERALVRRNRDLLMAQDTTIHSLTALAGTRDDETGGHILRTQNFVRALAEFLATRPKYKKQLDKETIDLLYRSAPLHDIGKVGVVDRILLKYGKLTSDEFAEMREHVRYGRDTLLKAEARLHEDCGARSFLHVARELVYSHHEKWDGSGYPRGLRGEDIPLCGRLMALADVYDVLISRKRYKPGLSHEAATEIICKQRGIHFDPDVVDAFLASEKVFIEIVKRYPDEAEPYEHQNSSMYSGNVV